MVVLYERERRQNVGTQRYIGLASGVFEAEIEDGKRRWSRELRYTPDRKYRGCDGF